MREGNTGHLQIRIPAEASAPQVHQTTKIHFAERKGCGLHQAE